MRDARQLFLDGNRYLDARDYALAELRSGRLRVRQRPGPKNALGVIKFVFPNQEDVYMHGTPAQALFAINPVWGFPRAIIAGTVVTALVVVALTGIGRSTKGVAAAEAAPASRLMPQARTTTPAPRFRVTARQKRA